MYVVSFRIPFTIMGRTQYVNGSCRSPVRLLKGEKIFVTSNEASLAQAEVIESTPTQRNDFHWFQQNAI